MEQFVKLLYDRLNEKKDLQIQLYVIMQNAINEMHNNGIIASLTGDIAKAVHDADPDVRIREKTRLAKLFAKRFIPSTLPVPSLGGMSYLATLNYDPRFVNSITLCFQGGIEGLHMACAVNPNMKLDKYMIQVEDSGNDLTALINNMEQLDRMYDDISIVLMCNGKTIYSGQEKKTQPVSVSAEKPAEKPTEKPAEKRGFFAKLFGRKSKASASAAPAAPMKQEADAAQQKVQPAVPPISKPETPPVNKPAAFTTQTAAAPAKSPAPAKQQPAPAPKEQVQWLSDLKCGFIPAKAFSGEEIERLKKLGAAFFKNCDQIMVKESGNTPDLQLTAMSRFAWLLGSFNSSRQPFTQHAHAWDDGQLQYYADVRSGGTCYDGGCYSDEPDEHYYYFLRRISSDDYYAQKENRTILVKGEFSPWLYHINVPEADQTEVFAARDNYLYLKNPMGISGYYSISYGCE